MTTTTTRRPRTLESLRAELAARVGAAAGASFGYPLLNSFLQNAQSQLYPLADWRHLRTVNEQPVQIGQVRVDLPEDCNLERILGVWIGEGSNWLALRHGIDTLHRTPPVSGVPMRYEVRWLPEAEGDWRVQVELHPVTSSVRKLRMEYIRRLLPFEADKDTATLPDDLVLLHAITNAKLHFRQPDGAQYGAQLEAQLARVRAQHRRHAVVTPRSIGPSVLPEDLPYCLPPA